MSTISTEHKKKLQQLIYSEDFKNVVQGLELLDTVSEDEKDIYNVFDLIEKIPYSAPYYDYQDPQWRR